MLVHDTLLLHRPGGSVRRANDLQWAVFSCRPVSARPRDVSASASVIEVGALLFVFVAIDFASGKGVFPVGKRIAL
jgi:hypothetical protein